MFVFDLKAHTVLYLPSKFSKSARNPFKTSCMISKMNRCKPEKKAFFLVPEKLTFGGMEFCGKAAIVCSPGMSFPGFIDPQPKTI